MFFTSTKVNIVLVLITVAFRQLIAVDQSTSSQNSGSPIAHQALGYNDRHYYLHESSKIKSEIPITSESTEPSIVSAGECLNSSGDHHDCIESHHIEKASGETVHRSDNQRQLTFRLNHVDRLADDLKDGLSSENGSMNAWHAAGAETTLRQVLFIHRHGDRTPIQFPSKDPLKNEPFWKFHGFGQLTNRGKARLFLLGELMRIRYDKFLAKSVNKNQRISRSSGSLRCIESAQTFLSAFLGLNVPSSSDARQLVWDHKDNILAHLWQPASVQTIPVKLDGMLAESAECQILVDEYDKIIDSSPGMRDLSVKFKNEANVLNEVLGYEFDHFYKWYWASSQVEVERSYFEDKMDPRIKAIDSRLQAAGNIALGAYQSTIRSKRLRSGLLINDMVSNMKKFRDAHHQVTDDSPDLKKFVHYTAHDLTNVILLGMFDSWNQFPFRPEYASNIALELHHDDKEWFVRIYYMSYVPSKPNEIHISKCEEGHPRKLCTLDKFEKIMGPYLIDSWQNWMKECQNDLSQLNPYEPGS